MRKLAPQANSWYTRGLELLCPESADTLPRRVANLLRRLATMETLPLFDLGDNTPKRRCTGPCGRELPATPEIFGYDRRVKDGLQARCKDCKNAKRRKPPIISTIPEGYQQCTGPCSRVLLANTDNFYPRKELTHGLNRQCKDCVKQRVNDYYDRPDTRDQRREYRQRDEVKAKARERSKTPEAKIYHRNHSRKRYHRPDVRKKVLDYSRRPEVQAKRRENQNRHFKDPNVRAKKYAQQREYRNSTGYKAKRRVWFLNRLARKRAVSGRYTLAQIQELLKRQKYKCYYCATKFQRNGQKYIYHIEHTFPLSRVAGTDIPANDINYLVLACPHCNTSKGSRFPWEYPEGGRLF